MLYDLLGRYKVTKITKGFLHNNLIQWSTIRSKYFKRKSFEKVK